MEPVTVNGVAAGGDGVARLADGRAVFVRGALPGERVAIAVTEEKPRFARADLVEVVEPAAGRTAPPCPLVEAGCGGCGWQHVEHDLQRELKQQIVADALMRIGRLTDLPPIDPGPDLPPTGYRTTVRAAVVLGAAAFHVHHGADTVALTGIGCLVTHPLVDQVLRDGRFGAATEVTVRAGVATGERLAIVDPRADAEVAVPDGVLVVGGDELGRKHRVWIHEEVAGRRWRISARAFFQTRPDGAAALAEVVAAAAAPHLRSGSHVVDLYGGVGLLAGVLADRAGTPLHLQVVESNRAAAADARVNLADLHDTKVVAVDVRRWRPGAADVVVADPSRHGLGREVVDRVAATGASAVVLVSCDPGALGRDAGLLDGAGYGLASANLVDLFPHTPHVEVVTTWLRRERHPGGRPAP